MNAPVEEKQTLLEVAGIKARARKVLELINKEKQTDLQLTNHTKDLVTWVLVWVTLWVVLWVNTLLKLHLINRRCSRR